MASATTETIVIVVVTEPEDRLVPLMANWLTYTIIIAVVGFFVCFLLERIWSMVTRSGGGKDVVREGSYAELCFTPVSTRIDAV
ncbi:unnamed protein product [Caenorhabditis auriculariae]|uniref:Uncharacterized protein n=1 Tax=Caenorhabditis auriculariae TaxID=2777116 RepID=A0A8S1H4Z8_9PELO|nr:unnamed protein product [Caenorhabditis auriculariae]